MQIHRIGLKGATVSAMLFIFFLAFVCSVSAKDDVDAMVSLVAGRVEFGRVYGVGFGLFVFVTLFVSQSG